MPSPTIQPDSLSQRLKQAVAELPFASAALPGVGGTIKAVPEHFEVQEVLPYAPCGEGEHLYITLRRAGWNTADVARLLGEQLHVKMGDIGWGGRKDKQAVTTQTFSLLLPLSFPLAEIQARLNALPFEIFELKRHRNKIKTGHVAGNRFKILLSGIPADAAARAQDIVEYLQHTGIPNFYGEQRFGMGMKNIDRAFALLVNPKSVRGKQSKLMVSALQSGLFNLWLKTRMECDAFSQIVAGDVAQKTDTGGLFVVTDVQEAQERLQQHAIVYTGPIFGFKMMSAGAQEAQYESELLGAWGLDLQCFKSLRAPGSRRAAILWPADLSIQHLDQGLQFRFTLPSGAYATTVMREFMRMPPGHN